jgi:hypothetical protein
VRALEIIEAGHEEDGSGKRNVYRCPDCLRYMVTEDVVKYGVTPFMTGCESCGGIMTSAFYTIPPDLPHKEPTHEWYRPDDVEITKHVQAADVGWLDHVAAGGLCLRAK